MSDDHHGQRSDSPSPHRQLADPTPAARTPAAPTPAATANDHDDGRPAPDRGTGMVFADEAPTVVAPRQWARYAAARRLSSPAGGDGPARQLLEIRVASLLRLTLEGDDPTWQHDVAERSARTISTVVLTDIEARRHDAACELLAVAAHRLQAAHGKVPARIAGLTALVTRKAGFPEWAARSMVLLTAALTPAPGAAPVLLVALATRVLGLAVLIEGERLERSADRAAGPRLRDLGRCLSATGLIRVELAQHPATHPHA
jgi:hypothetical protein